MDEVTLKWAVSVSYGLLFLFGAVGNSLVIATIINVLSLMRKKRSHSTALSTHHVFIYILGLSVVDLMVMLHLPFLISDIILGQWIFGTILCKLYWIGECVNKLLSTFILTVLSWDRYMAVCSPIASLKLRKNKVAVWVLLSCSVGAFLLLLPVLIQSSAIPIDPITVRKVTSSQLAASNGSLSVLVKCVFEGDSGAFLLLTFSCGYLLPALLISFFYAKVLYSLRRSARSVVRFNPQLAIAHNPRLQQVTKRIVAVILFYFVCWTPQWLLNVLSHLELLSWSRPLALNALFFSAHLLVCFNSAANPILYAYINNELRQQHYLAMEKRRQSLSSATHAAMDFFGRRSHSLVPFRRKSSPSGTRSSSRRPTAESQKLIETFSLDRREQYRGLSLLPLPSIDCNENDNRGITDINGKKKKKRNMLFSNRQQRLTRSQREGCRLAKTLNGSLL